MNELMKKKWARVMGIIVLCIAVVYGMIYADVLLRARSAYLEGEKYWSWYENPAAKESALKAEFEKKKAAFDKKLAANKMNKDDYDKEIEIIKFDLEQKLGESSIKYAYIWYQTVVELFSPPESKWVKLSREKMPKAKELWKQELRKKNIPFEDYMLE
jgi:hypothetical protein